MDISMVIQEFRFDCRIRKLSPKTIENYGKQLSYLQRYLAEEHDISAIEAVRSIHIKQFLAMMDEKGRKPQYINDLLKVFKTFFNYRLVLPQAPLRDACLGHSICSIVE